MKIKELKREPLFVIEFSEKIVFTDYGEYETGVFTLEELNTLGDWIAAILQDHDRSIRTDRDEVVFASSVDDPSNVDTDPPDEYNVYSDQDGHACNTTVDGG